jgi:hypothetical protein
VDQRVAGSTREVGPQVVGGEGHVDVGAVGVGVAEDPLAAVRGAPPVPEGEPLEQHDPHPRPRRLPGGGEAHGAPADDDEVDVLVGHRPSQPSGAGARNPSRRPVSSGAAARRTR